MSEPTSTNTEYDLLLRSGIQAARRGQRATARAIFEAITDEHPHAVRAWLALAGVAESRAGQRAALERALALEPTNALARKALEHIGQIAPEPTASAAETPAADPAGPKAAAITDDLDRHESLAERRVLGLSSDRAGELGEASANAETHYRRVPGWLVITALGAALGLAIGYFLLPLLSRPAPLAQQPSPVLQLLTVVATTDAAPSSPPAQPTSAATARPPQATNIASREPSASPALEPTTTALPAPLAMGTLQEFDGWSATLLRPDYALIFDGALGELQPSGRFVLALVSVSNSGPAARRIPPDLFELLDQQGRRYQPLGGASTAYLALFGRGQYGDLALEDEIAPGGSLFSVPVVFDVPLDSSGLLLTVGGNQGAGWQVQESAGPITSPNIGP